MNTLIAWFGFGQPSLTQVDKTAKDTPVDAMQGIPAPPTDIPPTPPGPITRATYREVLLRSVDGTPEFEAFEAATIATYVVLPRDGVVSSRLVYADV
jgi:hypothetical protein